jgi:hypothetical protein
MSVALPEALLIFQGSWLDLGCNRYVSRGLAYEEAAPRRRQNTKLHLLV